MCKDGLNGFFSAGSDGFVVHWKSIDCNDGELFAQVPEPIFSIAYILDLEMILAGTQSGKIYYLKKGAPPLVLELHQKSVFGIWVVSLDEIYTAGGDGYLHKIDWYRRKLNSIKLIDNSLRSVIRVNQDLYVAGSSSEIFKLTSDFDVVHFWKAHGNSIFCLASNDQFLVSAGRDAKIKVWNFEHQLEQVIDAHWFTIHGLAFSPNNQYFISTSMDKTIRIWDGKSFKLLKVIDHLKFEGHKSSVNSALWINDNTFISCSDDNTIKCWQILN
jgi:WD40 repeat protein